MKLMFDWLLMRRGCGADVNERPCLVDPISNNSFILTTRRLLLGVYFTLKSHASLIAYMVMCLKPFILYIA